MFCERGGKELWEDKERKKEKGRKKGGEVANRPRYRFYVDDMIACLIL